MKLIAYLIITASVIFGSLASSTAYLVRLEGSNPDELSNLNLGSSAGLYDPASSDSEFAERLALIQAQLDAERAVAANPLKPAVTPREPAAVPEVDTAPTGESVLGSREAVAPVGRAGDRLAPELVELLLESNVTFVKVTEFSINRWPYAWLFGISCVGMLCGAWIIRRAQRLELAAAESNDPASSEDATDAETVFARISGRLNTLSEEIAKASDQSARIDSIVHHIGLIQRDDIPLFAADRPALVNRLSLAGYAELMDSFAAMERQLNRAWSAAADSDLAESEVCLQKAQPLLIETLQRLKKS